MVFAATFMIGVCLVLAYGVVRGLRRSINLNAFGELNKPPSERNFKLPSEEREERERKPEENLL